MRDEVMKHLMLSLGSEEVAQEYVERFEIVNDAHFGGYGKTTPELLAFIMGFKDGTGIQLEPVYTAKMMWALAQRTPEAGRLAIHTGGLQGLAGFDLK